MEFSIIAAVAKDKKGRLVIGNKGKLPWEGDKRFSEDLRRFRDLTFGHSVIMGRKTYESILERIGGRVLEGRRNIVITRDRTRFSSGACFVHSTRDARIKTFSYNDDAFVIGGESVYADMARFAQNMYLTWINGEYEGDAFLSKIHWDEWLETRREDRTDYSFIDYRRK